MIVLGAVGLNGSGKDALIEYLHERHGIQMLSMGDVVRELGMISSWYMRASMMLIPALSGSRSEKRPGTRRAMNSFCARTTRKRTCSISRRLRKWQISPWQ